MHKTTIVTFTLVSLTLLSGAILSSSLVSADNDSVVDQINITIPVSCTLSGTGMNSHNAEINNGQYNSAIGETTIKAFCNDNEGFAIYAIGYTNSEEGNNVLTNSTLGSTYDIATGTATSGNTSNWAMKLSTITGSTPTYPIIIAGTTEDTLKEQGDPDYSTFQQIPDDYTKVAYRTSNTDISTSAEGSTLTTTYQAYISPTQPAGTYTGQVKYTLVHPHIAPAPEGPKSCSPNKICYFPNKYDVTDTMNDQSNNYADDTNTITSNTEINLWPSNFQYHNHGFAGWNTKYNYTGDNLGPMQRINTGDISTKGLSLYAIWVETSGVMQNWQGCSSLGDNEVVALTDNRDNQTYAVAKLADGNCWMIENLRLGGDTEMTLTTLDTQSAGVLPATTNAFGTSNTIKQLNILNTQSPVATMNGVDSAVFSYGNYYSWAAAINSTESFSDKAVSTSICPSGWRLPSSNNYSTLSSRLNTNTSNSNSSNIWRSYPNNFLLSGVYLSTSPRSRGDLGDYWSSKSSRVSYALTFDFKSSTLRPSVQGNKYLGHTVRCLTY